jgi:L-fucose mutarotase/ribose pyranase (RbsD/FucU family)
VARDDVSVTLRMAVTMMGRQMPPKDTKIMLDKPYQPYMQGDSDAKVTTLGEGDETVTVDGKSYKCHWVKVKVVATKPVAVESTTKAWSSKDVPLSGMVKMEIESVMTVEGNTMNTKTTMRLTGSGR